MLITREKLALAKYAPKNHNCKAVRRLYLKGDQAIVTDGNILIAVKDTEEVRLPDSDYPDIGVKDGYTPDDLITPATAEKVLRNMPKKEALPVLERAIMDKEEETLKFGCTDLDTSVIISQRNIDECFPDLEKEINQEGEEIIVLDVALMEKAIKALKEFKPVRGRVSLHKFRSGENEAAGITFRCKNGPGASMIVLVMGIVKV